jgi:hypothetical protein
VSIEPPADRLTDEAGTGAGDDLQSRLAHESTRLLNFCSPSVRNTTQKPISTG